MAKITPAQMFPGITVTASGITIPFTDLPGVDQAEVDPTTGDAAVLFRGLTEGAYNRVNAIPAADRPQRFTMIKNTQSTVPNQFNMLRQPYTVTFDITAASFEVAAE